MRFLKNQDEEKINSITHSFGAGFLVCVLLSADRLETSLYCLGMLSTMLLSTLYHGTEELKAKSYFRMLDMLSIHITIAVTSCAYMMLYNSYYLCVFAVVLAILGVFYTVRNYGDSTFESRNVHVYLMVGLLCSTCTVVVLMQNQSVGISHFLYGLLFFLGGLIFYVRDSIKWFHTIWHVFVMMASYFHLKGIAKILETI